MTTALMQSSSQAQLSHIGQLHKLNLQQRPTPGFVGTRGSKDRARQKLLVQYLSDAAFHSQQQILVHLSRQGVIQQDIGPLLVRAKGPD